MTEAPDRAPDRPAADLDACLAQAPVIAILRGVRPSEAVAVGEALLGAGVRVMEVPLNSPEPLVSISAMAERLGGEAVIGAGTVLTEAEVDSVAAVGGRLIVSPNTNPSVIARALSLGLEAAPGVASPTDAFAALTAGAHRLKLFPAGPLGPAYLSALRAVLPGHVQVFAVGGVGAHNAADWRAAGAAGFGIGSELYRPGDSPATVGAKAAALLNALAEIAPANRPA